MTECVPHRQHRAFPLERAIGELQGDKDAVYVRNITKHRNAFKGQTSEFFVLNVAVHIITTRP